MPLSQQLATLTFTDAVKAARLTDPELENTVFYRLGWREGERAMRLEAKRVGIPDKDALWAADTLWVTVNKERDGGQRLHMTRETPEALEEESFNPTVDDLIDGTDWRYQGFPKRWGYGETPKGLESKSAGMAGV